jgi:hypothetical protein
LNTMTSNPFTLPGHWFRGNLHVHSTLSDGDLAPERVLNWYRSQGYHFLALTDHDVLSEARSLGDGFITLSGIEVGGTDPASGLFHLVGLGVERQPAIGVNQTMPLQEGIDGLRAAGGLVALAHPYWSGQMSRDLLGLEGCFALEVYNGSCEVLDCKGLSVVHWDDLLAAGERPGGLAVDDAHWRPGPRDAGLGWVWVKAMALTQEAILDALAKGHFYASSGPQLYDVTVQEDRVQVRCSPAVIVDFVGNGRHSSRLMAPAGETYSEVSYRLRKGQRYVRVACRDAQGCWAWSNAIFLNADAEA